MVPTSPDNLGSTVLWDCSGSILRFNVSGREFYNLAVNFPLPHKKKLTIVYASSFKLSITLILLILASINDVPHLWCVQFSSDSRSFDNYRNRKRV